MAFLRFVRSPRLGAAKPAYSNHDYENHLLLYVPIQYRSWGVPEYRDDFRVKLQWMDVEYWMTIAGGLAPAPSEPLRQTRSRVVPVVVRSLIGEEGDKGVRLSTFPKEMRVDAPKEKARLLEFGAMFKTDSPRIDFPTGNNELRMKIIHGENELIHEAGYRLFVPEDGSNDRFALDLIWS